jgi:hypothetical protein
VPAALFHARLTGQSRIGGGPWRFGSGCLLVFLLGVTSGCYVYTPALSNPAPGTDLQLELNDRGRAALGTSIGPTGGFVEGVMQSNSDSAYSLRVEKVQYLNGQSNRWNGEPLIVPKDFVGTTRQRTFSAGRSWLTAGALTMAALAFISTRQLLGAGSEGKGPNNGPPNTN